MFRFINFIVFLIAIVIFLVFFHNIKITQEVLDLFPKTKDKEIIDIYQKFSNSRNIFVAIKGFDKKSHDDLMSFLYKINDIPNIQGNMTRTKPTQELDDYIASNYLYIATPKPLNNVFTTQQIKDKIIIGLNEIKKQIDEDEKLDSGIISKDTKIDSNDTTSFFHPSDPLGIFSLKLPKSHIFVAKDYGYMALIEMKDISQDKVKETLQEFEKIANKYPQIRYFSQNFMGVKNLDLILSEVTYLLTFATLALIILYFVIIRIPMLTLNAICTISIANIVSMFVVSMVYQKVTIMALSFGMGISNIAIDYMMHHNFFNLYAQKNKIFNKPVFYGYMTTIVGFVACLFVPFPLLSQLSLYAIISLSICYISFAFIYPIIGFESPRLFPKLVKLRFQVINSYLFLIIAACGFYFAFSHIKLDFDLSKLDYQNKPMLQERDFFDKSQDDVSQILLSSYSIDGLISLAKKLQYTLDSNNKDSKAKTFIPLSIMPTIKQIQENKKFLESSIFINNKNKFLESLPKVKHDLIQELKKDKNIKDKDEKEEFLNDLFEFFKDSYQTKEIVMPTLEQLSKMGFTIIENKENGKQKYYYLALIKDNDLSKVENFVKKLDYENKEKVITQNNNVERLENINKQDSNIELRSLQHIMDNLTNTIYKPMLIILGIALFLMICMLFITARGAFIDSVAFILFPLACSLSVISFHSDLNIMHLFALLILVVVNIDYGIYSVKEGDNPRTAHAIFFSVITTGASFGILIISKTKAINSFGEVIFTGMLCILIMLVFQYQNKKKLH